LQFTKALAFDSPALASLSGTREALCMKRQRVDEDAASPHVAFKLRRIADDVSE
jgi:hypothetical protein